MTEGYDVNARGQDDLPEFCTFGSYDIAPDAPRRVDAARNTPLTDEEFGHRCRVRAQRQRIAALRAQQSPTPPAQRTTALRNRDG